MIHCSSERHHKELKINRWRVEDALNFVGYKQPVERMGFGDDRGEVIMIKGLGCWACCPLG